jgi:heme exporter protein D
MQEFLHMGGYARFVWPAYGLAFLVLGWNVWSALRLERTAREHARRRALIVGGEGGDHASR